MGGNAGKVAAYPVTGVKEKRQKKKKARAAACLCMLCL